MEWNEATGTNQGLMTYELDLQTPIDGLAVPAFPLKDSGYWAFNQQTQTEIPPAEMTTGGENNASAEKNRNSASDTPPSPQGNVSGKGSRSFIFGFSVALALSLLLSLTALLNSKQRLELPTPSPPLVRQFSRKSEVDELIERFTSSAGDLRTTWRSSSLTVQEAFRQHFTPLEKEGVYINEDNVWDMLEVQKNAFLATRPNDTWSAEKKSDFLKHGKLLTAIFDASTERLRQLGRLEKTAASQGIPIPLIEAPAGEHWPSYEGASQEEKTVTFKEFVDMLPQERREYLSTFAYFAGDDDSEDEGYSGDEEDEEEEEAAKYKVKRGNAVVSFETATKLADLIRIEDIQSEDDHYICEHFDGFASIFGLRLATMMQTDAKNATSFHTLADTAPFSTSEFLRFLKYRYERASDTYVDPRVFKHLAKSWSEKTVEELTEQMLDDQRRRAQDVIQEKVMTVLTANSEQDEIENTMLLLSVFLL